MKEKNFATLRELIFLTKTIRGCRENFVFNRCEKLVHAKETKVTPRAQRNITLTVATVA
jgi:hypothetical protein